MLDFEGIKPGESLACFIDRVVNPDTEYLEQCGKTIDDVTKLLQSKVFSLKLMRTIKGGSIGKGTAVRGRSDVDLIFPITTIKSVDVLQEQMTSILECVIQVLMSSNLGVNKDTIKSTPWAVIAEIWINDSWQQVDIMPIASIANDPSHLSDSEINFIHQEMKGSTNEIIRNYYNRCLRPLQMKFIGQHSEKIKRVIRLIKYWVKSNEHNLIKSVAVELLVIRAWEDLGKPHPSVPEKSIAKVVFDMLRNLQNLKLSWTKYYNPANFELPSAPYILDPVDPYNNVISQIAKHFNTGAILTQGDIEVREEVSRIERNANRAYQCF